MSPVYCPGNPYPTIWERLAKMMGRKNNRPLGKKQQPRKVKGRSKPPHKGGKDKGGKGGKGGGWL